MDEVISSVIWTRAKTCVSLSKEGATGGDEGEGERRGQAETKAVGGGKERKRVDAVKSGLNI